MTRPAILAEGLVKTFGKDVTSRTWDALARIVKKAPG